MTSHIESLVADERESLLAVVVAVLEHDLVAVGPNDRDLIATLVAVLRTRGLPGELDAPLRAGGRAELLLAVPGSPGLKVAVLPAIYGATDAVRARLRSLAAHSEIDAVVVASRRPRHRALAGEVAGVAVRVAQLPNPSG